MSRLRYMAVLEFELDDRLESSSAAYAESQIAESIKHHLSAMYAPNIKIEMWRMIDIDPLPKTAKQDA